MVTGTKPVNAAKAGGFQFVMYSCQTSSVTYPLLSTGYPLAHRCRPQW